MFKLLINSYFLFIKKANLGNFDNLIFPASQDISLREMLKSKSQEAINCFDTNLMYTNPDTSQAIAVDHNRDTNENYTLKASNIEIESKNSVKLLGIKTDNKLLRQKNCFIMQKSSQSVTCNLQTTKSNGKKKKKNSKRVLFTPTLIMPTF